MGCIRKTETEVIKLALLDVPSGTVIRVCNLSFKRNNIKITEVGLI